VALGVGPIPTWVNAVATSFRWFTTASRTKVTRQARSSRNIEEFTSSQVAELSLPTTPVLMNNKQTKVSSRRSESWLSFAICCWQQDDDEN